MNKIDGIYARELTKIQKQDLLIIDDFAIEYLDKHESLNLFEIIENRHGLQSTLMTAKLPIDHRHDIIFLFSVYGFGRHRKSKSRITVAMIDNRGLQPGGFFYDYPPHIGLQLI